MISASSLDRVIACPASEALEHGPDVGTKYAADGNDAHARLAEMVRTCTLPTELATYGGGYRAEVAYAYSPATDSARELVSNGPRDYSDAKPGEICGTVDAIGAAHVVDWKTGFFPAAKAAENAQLAIFALIANRIEGHDDVLCELVYVKPKTLELRYVDGASIDIFAIDALASSLKELPARIAEQREMVTLGKKTELAPADRRCRYCPAVTCAHNGNKESKSLWQTTRKVPA